MLLVLRTEVLQMALPKYFKRDRQIKLTDKLRDADIPLPGTGNDKTLSLRTQRREERGAGEEFAVWGWAFMCR